MSTEYRRPKHLPPLPELPPGHVWHSRASAEEAFTVLSQGYERASQLLRLEDGDPIRLRLHSEQITRRCLPIYEALCQKLPPNAIWTATCRNAFDLLVQELDNAAEASDKMYVPQ